MDLPNDCLCCTGAAFAGVEGEGTLSSPGICGGLPVSNALVPMNTSAAPQRMNATLIQNDTLKRVVVTLPIALGTDDTSPAAPATTPPTSLAPDAMPLPTSPAKLPTVPSAAPIGL